MNYSLSKYAVCTIAYNEADLIKACIANWKGVVDKHLVLVSAKPWNGSTVEDDGTYRKAKEAGAEVILGGWPTEALQRSWGLVRLYDYDYVIIVDPDEFYTKVDQEKLLKELDNPYDKNFSQHQNLPGFRCNRIETYFKTMDYIFLPADSHKPFIAVDPKQLICEEHRQFHRYLDGRFLSFAPVIDVTIHHMSWVKTDAKVKEKIQSYSHADQVGSDWYDNVWLKWEPGSDMKVRPYGMEPSIAHYSPAPDEIKELILKNQ